MTGRGLDRVLRIDLAAQVEFDPLRDPEIDEASRPVSANNHVLRLR
jgi:hypothetical protein